MFYDKASEYVLWAVDDTGNGDSINASPFHTVRKGYFNGERLRYRSVLVGWQCGFEPAFVAVHSYLDCRIDEDEAIEIATDYLVEIGWLKPDFDGEFRSPDYVIR